MHFAAGPWFEVYESGADWRALGAVWLSDGEHNEPGVLELRLRFADAYWAVEDGVYVQNPDPDSGAAGR